MTYFVMLTTTASLHMGTCFYINAMVNDLRVQLAPGPAYRADPLGNWSNYVKQFQLHNDLLK